jgi:hypothetical protein
VAWKAHVLDAQMLYQLLLSTQTFCLISSWVRRMGGPFCPTVRWIDSMLLLILRVVVLGAILLVFPSSVLPESSLSFPLFLLLILRTRGVALLGHQRKI